MSPGSVVALVGAQYGSEGKGAIAAKIAKDFHVHIRTGAPNAGHTYYMDCTHPAEAMVVINDDGQGHTEWGCEWCRNAPDRTTGVMPDGRVKVVARSVPVGASNPHASLVIGPGGMLDLELLTEEVEMLNSLGLRVSGRLLVDEKALVIDPTRHKDYEGGIRGHAHAQIGSTGEGVGIARMAHLARNVLGKDFAWSKIDHAGDKHIREFLAPLGITVIDTVPIVNSWIEAGQNVLLEGTQGSGLSSVHGPWPYCTSADANAGQLCTDAGISPQRLNSVILVARTHPIRVAGNSGPLENEMTWEQLGVEPETTTVTKKVRRVGAWSDHLIHRAIMLNGPTVHFAITFMDYVDSRCAGETDWARLSRPVSEFVWEVEREHDNYVDYIGTGPDSVCVSPRAKYGRR